MGYGKIFFWKKACSEQVEQLLVNNKNNKIIIITL